MDSSSPCPNGRHGRFTRRCAAGSTRCFRCGTTWPAVKDDADLTARPSDLAREYHGHMIALPTMDQLEAGGPAVFEDLVTDEEDDAED